MQISSLVESWFSSIPKRRIDIYPLSQDYSPICTFEDDCDWYNNGWTLQSGPTPSDTTGPTFDHSTGQTAGHFMYHGGDTEKTSVKLSSLVLRQTEQSSCQLRFYYYMYGANVGKLTVGTVQYGGNGTENVSNFRYLSSIRDN